MSENEEVVAILTSGVLEDSGGLVEHSDQRDSVFVSQQGSKSVVNYQHTEVR